MFISIIYIHMQILESLSNCLYTALPFEIHPHQYSDHVRRLFLINLCIYYLRRILSIRGNEQGIWQHSNNIFKLSDNRQHNNNISKISDNILTAFSRYCIWQYTNIICKVSDNIPSAFSRHLARNLKTYNQHFQDIWQHTNGLFPRYLATY